MACVVLNMSPASLATRPDAIKPAAANSETGFALQSASVAAFPLQIVGLSAVRLEERGVLDQLIDVLVSGLGELVRRDHRIRLLVVETDRVLVLGEAAVLIPQPRDIFSNRIVDD